MLTNSLYTKACRGDKTAEEQLFRHLTLSFRLFAQLKIKNQHDCEEVVQEAVMTIVKKYKDMKFHTSFAAWANQVLKNKLMDYFKYKKPRQGTTALETCADLPERSYEMNPLFKLQLLACLKKINRKDNRHARILNMHYLGFNTDEICEKMKITKNHLYVILSKVRTLLETCLTEGEING